MFHVQAQICSHPTQLSFEFSSSPSSFTMYIDTDNIDYIIISRGEFFHYLFLVTLLAILFILYILFRSMEERQRRSVGDGGRTRRARVVGISVGGDVYVPE